MVGRQVPAGPIAYSVVEWVDDDDDDRRRRVLQAAGPGLHSSASRGASGNTDDLAPVPASSFRLSVVDWSDSRVTSSSVQGADGTAMLHSGSVVDLELRATSHEPHK